MVLAAYSTWIVVTSVYLARAVRTDPTLDDDAGEAVADPDRAHPDIARLESAMSEMRQELDRLSAGSPSTLR